MPMQQALLNGEEQSSLESHMLQRFALILVASLAVSGVVHRPLFSNAFTGADMARVAMAQESVDLASQLLTPVETAVAGTSPLLWSMIGWVLLALVATLWGLAASRLMSDQSSTPIVRSAGLWTAISLAAIPAGYDCIVSPAGHVVLSMALLAALSLHGALLWPNLFTQLVLPIALGLTLHPICSPVFFLIGPLTLFFGSKTKARLLTRRAVVIAFSLALVAWLWRLGAAEAAPPLQDTLDAAAAGPAETMIRSLTALLSPAPLVDSDSWSLWVGICFGASIILTGILGHFAARGTGRGLALSALGLVALAFGMTLFRPALPESLLCGRDLLAGMLGLALFFGVAARALTRTSWGWVVPFSLLVIMVGAGSLCVRQQATYRLDILASPELNALKDQIQHLRQNIDAPEIVVIGAENSDIPGLREAFVASTLPPFQESGSPLLRAVSAHSKSDLLTHGKNTLIVDWRPSNLAFAAARPKGWVLAPTLLHSPANAEDSPIRLIAPAQDASRVLRRPETLDEDMSFTFEVREPFLRSHELVFYGFYAGGFNPNGKQQLTGRILAPSVLSGVQKDGWTQVTWRTSIRPGPGQDGVRFEDPDLRLSGKTLFWTVGIIPKQEPCEKDHNHEETHAHQDLTSPRFNAPFHRLHCLAP